MVQSQASGFRICAASVFAGISIVATSCGSRIKDSVVSANLTKIVIKWLVSDCSSSLIWLCCTAMQLMPAQSRRGSIAGKMFGVGLWVVCAETLGSNASSNCTLNYNTGKTYHPEKKLKTSSF